MKMIIPAACAILLAAAGSATGLTITESGVPRAVIVTGANPPETVGFAARELQAFVKKMSGAELPVAETAEPGMPSILLGPAARAKLGEAALAGVERDGYLITESGGDLCIVGLDDAGPHTDIEALLARGVTHDVTAWTFHRGTLYGVYRLLEELGMRWFLPGEFGERAPRRETLAFANTIRENPHFITRAVGYWSLWIGVNFRKDWEKFNIVPGERAEIGFTAVDNRLWELRMRGESFRIPLNHSPVRARWSERFAADHPEYFALLPDGKRDLDPSGHLCYTRPGVTAGYVEDIRAFAAGQDAHERGIMTNYPTNRNWSYDIALDRYYSVLPNDGFRQCLCPDCRALVPADPEEANQRHSKLVWDFVARVARQVPEMNIVNLAYGSYSVPYPGMEKLPPNVVVGFCAYSNPGSLYRGDNYRRFEELLGRWAALSAGNMAYWQHYLSSNRSEENVGVPEHIPEMYARVIRALAKHGNHAFCEMMADSIMFELFNRYLLLKLFYDPTLDERAIFDDYVATFYGPDAGPLIARIYGNIEQRTIERFSNNYAAFSTWELLFPEATMREYHALADQALAKAAGTPYENAVSAFKKYYLGLMERGRVRYADPVAQLLASFNPELKSRRVAAPVTVDGKLDEAAWRAAETVSLGNTVNGRATARRTEVRTCHDDAYLYLAVSADDPGAGAPARAGNPGDGGTDGVMIFLDAPRNYQGYYRVGVDFTGAVYDYHYVDHIILARPDWRSRAWAAAGTAEGRRVVEVAIPWESLGLTREKASLVELGVLVARVQVEPPKPEEQRSSTSIILRGELAQPGFFNALKLIAR